MLSVSLSLSLCFINFSHEVGWPSVRSCPNLLYRGPLVFPSLLFLSFSRVPRFDSCTASCLSLRRTSSAGTLHFEASLQQAGGKEKEGRDDQNGRLSRNDCGGGWMGTLRSISLCVSPSSFTDPLSRKMGHHLSDLWGENVKNSRREKKKLYLRRRDVEKESVIVDTKPIRFVGFCV